MSANAPPLGPVPAFAANPGTSHTAADAARAETAGARATSLRTCAAAARLGAAGGVAGKAAGVAGWVEAGAASRGR